MGGRGVSSGMSGGRSVELYRRFIEGDAFSIHTADESTKRELDKVFAAATQDMHVYKGIPIDENEVNMRGLQQAIKSYSSTSMSKVTAEYYADTAYDIGESMVPVVVNMIIKKGTPIADARKILGNGGMREFEKEITVGRGVEYSYSNLRMVGDRWYVDAVVRRKRR